MQTVGYNLNVNLNFARRINLMTSGHVVA